MNLYNLFESNGDDDSLGYNKYFKKPEQPKVPAQPQRFHGWDEYDRAVGARKPQPEHYGDDERITEEFPEELDEVAMNPRAFSQAIKGGAQKGVLVGFEFETCIPRTSVDAWKNGEQPATPGYDPNSTAWLAGKTVNDLIDGIVQKGNGRMEGVFDDLFKYKNSVKQQYNLPKSSIWQHYRSWARSQVQARMANMDVEAETRKRFYEFLHSSITATETPEHSTARVEYGAATYLDFFYELAKESEINLKNVEITPDTVFSEDDWMKVRDALRKFYYKTNSPQDRLAHDIINFKDNAENTINTEYTRVGAPEETATVKQHFSDFCQQTLGTTDMTELLKKKWAFKGRVNNATPFLKEKLWYYITPNAEMPASMNPRSHNSSDYMDGAEFLKANLKDLFGGNIEIFRNYHQAAKKLDRWYIEPDGSLHANGRDYTAEVVSPPLKADVAMAALKNWYQRAAELKLYTNNSTGLHINVSIPDSIDVLKLAVFAGDQYVLKKFGREDNRYANSVIKSLRRGGAIPSIDSTEFKDAESAMKDIVKRISGDHFATINFNGKYVSFRHAGGDYLSKAADIANTVGRFVRAMMLAADPAAHRDEYIGKLVAMMSPEKTVKYYDPKDPENKQTPTKFVDTPQPGFKQVVIPGGSSSRSDGMSLSDIRNITGRGIPVRYIDLAVRSGQNPSDLLGALQYSTREMFGTDNINIAPDPSARERLLSSSGISHDTKEYVRHAPDEMFFRAVVYPNSRRSLEALANSYSRSDTERGPAYGVYTPNSRTRVGLAVAHSDVIKSDDPKYTEVVKRLRGGAVKPAPLPGTSAAPELDPATFRSQRPQDEPSSTTATDENPWGILVRSTNRLLTNIGTEDTRGFPSREEAQAYIDRNASNPSNFTPRLIDDNGDDNSDSSRTEQWGIFGRRINRLVTNTATGNPFSFPSREDAQAYIDSNATNTSEYVVRLIDGGNDDNNGGGGGPRHDPSGPVPIPGPGARSSETDSRPTYSFSDTDGNVRAEAQFSTVDNALSSAADMARRRGQIIGVHRDGELIGWGHPNGRSTFATDDDDGDESSEQEQEGNEWGIFSRGANTFLRSGGNPFNRSAPVASFPTQGAAETWARYRNIDPNNIEIRVVPAELTRRSSSQEIPDDDDNRGYHVVDSSGRVIGQTHATEDDALEAAQYLADLRQGTYYVNNPDGERVGGARPNEGDDGEQEEDEGGDTFDLVNNQGRLFGQYLTADEASDAAQEVANQRDEQIWVRSPSGSHITFSAPQTRSQRNTPQMYRFHLSRYDTFVGQERFNNATAAYQQGVEYARTFNSPVIITNSNGDRLVASPSDTDLTEARIFHADEKVNVVYQPQNGKGKLVVAKAVDHMMANRIISTYVHKSKMNPQRAPVRANDFVLNPAKGYVTSEDQYGGGFGGGSIAPVTDTTSPVGGSGMGSMGESNKTDKEADYGDEYQAMVKRVAAQEKRKRERQQQQQQQKQKQVEEEMLESRLYAMKRAGYDIL